VVIMPDGQECDPSQGQSPQLADGVAVRENGRAVCVLEQHVGNPATGSPPADPGWYYDYYTAEGRENCENSPSEPWQRIAFTAQPPSGAEVRLECFQSVTAVGEGDITIGTFCDPATDTLCGGAMNP